MNIATIDFETFYCKGYTLKGMSTSEYIRDARFRALGVALKVNDEPAKWIPGDAVASTLAHLKSKLERCYFLHHHAQFDGAILAWHYGITPRCYLDTMAMARGLGFQRSGLEQLAALFCIGQKPPLTPESTPEEIELRGTWDADATYALFKHLVKGYPAKELRLIDWTVRAFTQPSLLVDPLKLEQVIVEIEKANAERLDDLGLTKKELRSADNFARILTDYGVEPPTKISPRTGEETWAFDKGDPGFIELKESDDPTISAIIAARLGVTSNGDITRARRLLAMSAHGEIPIYLSYYAAHTGRWGGGDKTNFQNLRRRGKLRDAVIAPDGKSLVVGDFSQIEARITAWIAFQLDLVEGFRENREIYCEFGSTLYDRAITKSDITERYVSKTGVLGCGFGCGWKKFKNQVRAKGGIEISDELAQRTVQVYREVNGRIVDMWNTAEHFLGHKETYTVHNHLILTSHGDSIELPNGMFLRYPNLRYESYTTTAKEKKRGWRYDSIKGRVGIWGGGVLENIAQALARIVMVDKKLELLDRGFLIPTSTHDEIVVCVDDAQAKETKALMEQIMSTPIGWYETLPLAAEVNIGKTYGEAK